MKHLEKQDRLYTEISLIVSQAKQRVYQNSNKKKRDSLRHELSWTHYRILSRLETEPLRKRYALQCIEGNWNTRTLQRNIKTQYIGRILEEEDPETPVAKQLIKDPYIFEFLGITKDIPSSENNIETALINHIQHFMMELGKNELELKRLMEQDRIKFELDNLPE